MQKKIHMGKKSSICIANQNQIKKNYGQILKKYKKQDKRLCVFVGILKCLMFMCFKSSAGMKIQKNPILRIFETK